MRRPVFTIWHGTRVIMFTNVRNSIRSSLRFSTRRLAHLGFRAQKNNPVNEHLETEPTRCPLWRVVDDETRNRAEFGDRVKQDDIERLTQRNSGGKIH